MKLLDEASLIQIGSIETPKGLKDVQGYRVYSVNGVAISIRADGGGADKGLGLYLVIKNLN